MNCEQLREQLIETARRRDLPSDLRAEVFAHADRCGACARHLDAEFALSKALADLSLHASPAPARVWQRLQGEMPATRRASKRFAWTAFAAAAGLLIAFFTIPISRKAAAPSPAVLADGFVPIPYADTLIPGELTSIVHVELPRESLLTLGIPIDAEDEAGAVSADVMIGIDGTPRAIRLTD